MNNLSTALSWISMGVSPIPIRSGSKRPVIKWTQYQTELPKTSDVEKWFSRECGLAIVCGWRGLTVLDFDTMAQYGVFENRNPDAAQTYRVSTKRGMHCYYFSDTPLNTMLGGDNRRLEDGIDVKGIGGYVLAPPSIHPTGTPYTEHSNLPVMRVKDVNELIAPFLHEVTRPAPGSFHPPHTEQNALLCPLSSISEIKQRISLLSIVTRYTHADPSSNDGRWWIASCPFHRPDRNPSFWIDSVRGICSCYKTSCKAQQPNGRPMDVINFYSRLYGVSNRDAMIMLCNE